MGSKKGRQAENFRDEYRETERQRDRGTEGRQRGGDKIEPIGEEEEPEPLSPGSHKYWGFLL